MSEPTTEQIIKSLHKDNEASFCYIIPAAADRLQSLQRKIDEACEMLRTIIEIDQEGSSAEIAEESLSKLKGEPSE